MYVQGDSLQLNKSHSRHYVVFNKRNLRMWSGSRTSIWTTL